MNVVPLNESMQLMSDALERRGGEKSIVCEKLDGWKEIANYLRRSTRCVQRWQRMEGLPVLRHQHAKGATVYAYRQEIDKWRKEERTVFTEARENRTDSTNQLKHLGA